MQNPSLEILRSLHLLSESLPVGVLLADREGRCLSLNAPGCELVGLPPEKALDRGWLERLEAPGPEEVGEAWKAAAARGDPLDMELRFRAPPPAPPSAERIVLCRAVPLGELRGMEGRYLALLLDETEARRTESALRSTAGALEERVRELDCLFEISRAVERSAGSLPAIARDTVEVLARTWGYPEVACARIVLDGSSYETPGYAPSPWVQRAEIVAFGEVAGFVEVGYREERPPRDQGPFLAEEFHLLAAVAQRLGRTTERVRGRRLLQEREEETRERLTHLTRVSTMGEMASSIAHEVNQPLTAIATYAQACLRLLRGGEAALSEIMDVQERIAREALRAGIIVHRLKDLVRRQNTRWTECDLNGLIRDVEQLALVDARLHDVTLSFELAPDLPPVLADGIQIQQVVLNLIRNGIDAVEGVEPGRREVRLRTRRDGSRELRVSVDDNGCGLPPEADAQLFQPFFTTKEGGMGMGLSISRSIVTAHRGRIGFTRNPGAGATFFFTLPVLD